MQLQPEMTMDHEQAIRQLQRDQLEIRHDLDRCVKFITGNGDPTKGLLWLAADLGRLVASQGDMAEAHRQALQAHKTEGHYQRTGLWTRLGYRAIEQAVGIGITALLALLVIGAAAYLRGGA